MPFTATCKACGKPITFDPETQALEVRVYDEGGGKVIEYEVSCPHCTIRQWVKFHGNPDRP
jgi:hypothetical protein